MSRQLAAGFTQSYEETFKKHHNSVVKDIFSVRFQKHDYFFSLAYWGVLFIQVAMKACPYRADFYKKLAADPEGGASVTDEKLDQELDNWSEALDSIITRMETFYQKEGHNKGFEPLHFANGPLEYFAEGSFTITSPKRGARASDGYAPRSVRLLMPSEEAFVVWS
jgi:hypothetical protein